MGISICYAYTVALRPTTRQGMAVEKTKANPIANPIAKPGGDQRKEEKKNGVGWLVASAIIIAEAHSEAPPARCRVAPAIISAEATRHRAGAEAFRAGDGRANLI